MHLLLGEQLSANVRGHSVMDEKDTIVNYPDQIEALVTAATAHWPQRSAWPSTASTSHPSDSDAP